MSKTYAQLRTALGSWLGMNTTRLPDDVRGDMVNLARRELCRLHDMTFNEVSDTFATVAGTYLYALPAVWSRPYQMWYLDPDTGVRVEILYKSKEEFDILFPDSTTQGKPSVYTVWTGSILLAKTPDRVLTVNRDYYTVLADLVNDADVDPLPWEAVLFKALADASAFGIEDARIPLWQARAREIINGLTIAERRAKSAGRRAESQEPH